jgi:O-antigen/teichoic acid export membrane protein
MEVAIPKNKRKTADRLLFNTIVIYAQKFSTAALALVTTPLLLKVLGVVDYGIYTLTLGFVGTLTFFTWSLSSCTQRYISVTLGEMNFERLKTILSSTFFIHLIYGVIIFLVIQGINVYGASLVLNIPEARHNSIGSIITFVAGISFFGILSVPFLGVIRAEEKFSIIAILGLFESCCKLVIAALLLYMGTDKLYLFSLLMFLVSAVIFFSYYFVATRNSNKYYIGISYLDFKLMKEMLSFISWNLVGALAIMSRNQGVSVLLNLFFGVITNAAYGISQQINNAINILSQGVTGSMAPGLMRAAGEKNYEKMLYMMRTMSKMSFFSISIFSIPLYFEMPFVLKIWLGNIPEGSIRFARMTIMLVLIVIFSSGIQNVFVAIGKVKEYNLYVSILLMLNLPISYFLFKYKYPDYSIMIIGIVLELMSYFVRLWLLEKHLNYKIYKSIKELMLEIVLPFVVVFGLLFLMSFMELGVFVRITYLTIISFIMYPLIMFRFSLDTQQQNYIVSNLKKITGKFNRNGR